MSRHKEKPEHQYLNEFMECKCAPDMLEMRLFPNCKEITESFAAYDAVRSKLLRHYQFGDPKVIMISVGDGSTPRTAATFAYRSRWQCHSVDPLLGQKSRFLGIDRLKLHPRKIEDCTREDFRITDDSLVVITAVHSHAELAATVKVIGKVARMAIVAIPCCVKLSLPLPTRDVYIDHGIWSPSKTVLLWDI
jgi:hypothetical protein